MEVSIIISLNMYAIKIYFVIMNLMKLVRHQSIDLFLNKLIQT
jgi:hypothetical protein